MLIRFTTLVAIPLIAASAVAQPPSPVVVSRTAPRAEWIVTPSVAGGVPTLRHWSQAANSADKFFVFGGRQDNNSTRRNDLQEFDVATLTWTELSANGDATAPSARFRNGATWDPMSGKLIVFGGNDASGVILGDTWEYDPLLDTWTDISATAGTPGARQNISLAYDPITTGILMFGGQDAGGATLGDTWLLIGGSWIQLGPAAPLPGPRHSHAMVTRTDFGDVFLCSGSDFAAAPNRVHYTDAWTWNGGNWNRIVPSTIAVNAAFAGHMTFYDPIRQRVVMQGGNGISNSSAATGGTYGTEYGGSPTNWTSEFDCVSNEWLLYGHATPGDLADGDVDFDDGDPVIGRASRYYGGFVQGKLYLWGGQNPDSAGVSRALVKEYQADPIASSVAFETGCNGAGGVVTLTATHLPWLGTTYSYEATNLAPGSLVAELIGLVAIPSPTFPLSGVFPAAPDCFLLVDPIVSSPQINVGGTASGALQVPLAPALVGFTATHQMLDIVVSGASITSLAASNALTFTLGML